MVKETGCMATVQAFCMCLWNFTDHVDSVDL